MAVELGDAGGLVIISQLPHLKAMRLERTAKEQAPPPTWIKPQLAKLVEKAPDRPTGCTNSSSTDIGCTPAWTLVGANPDSPRQRLDR
jgi:hypothetical protein